MSEPQSGQDNLVGRKIGAFQIEEEIGRSHWGKVYRAMQTAVHRTVALKVLSAANAQVPGAVESFLAESQDAAQIVHPLIVAVYEAGHVDGVTMCAMEYMNGPRLADFIRNQDGVDEVHLLTVIAEVSRTLDYLWSRGVPHQVPQAKNILLNAAGEAKLVNIKAVDRPPSALPRDDIVALGLILGALANEIGQVSKLVGNLLQRMVGSQQGKTVGTLKEVADLAESLLQQMKREAAPAVVPDAPAPNAPKKTLHPVFLIVGVLVIVGAIVGVVIKFRKIGKVAAPWSHASELSAMVEIPGGEFIYQDGEKRALPIFYIDKYEVTIGQYKKFLDAIAAGETIKEHDSGKGHKDHKPLQWDNVVQVIESGGSFNDVKLTWDMPVFGVDWYDAYSYAAWRGKRLPTDEEWEKAARGTQGKPYPWGDAPDLTKANLAASDRHVRWAEVTEYPTDVSPNGAIGMGGNLSEWTSSSTTGFNAIVRGGSWRDKDKEALVTKRLTNIPREFRSDVIGFRCAADKPVSP